jgi:ketosteroid isomerase-like protein
MRRIPFVIVMALGVGLVGCARRAPVNLEAEAEKIRERSREWLAADSTRNVDLAVSMYSENAVEYAANTPAIFGKEAIRAWYRSWLPDTTTSIRFATEVVEVAASGDLAYERGTYRFTTNGPKGPTEDVGKYATVWRRNGDTWEVVLDMANSDQPLPPSAP